MHVTALTARKPSAATTAMPSLLLQRKPTLDDGTRGLSEPRLGHQFGAIDVQSRPVQIARQEASSPTTQTTTTGTTAEPPPRKKICMTFDDGPHPGTKDVLAALGAIKATFFLTGKRTAAPNRAEQAELLTAILAAGHRIGNHTLTHSPPGLSDYQKLKAQDPAEHQKVIGGEMTANQEYFQALFDEHAATFEAEGIVALPAFEQARLPGSGKNFPEFVKVVQDIGLIHVPWQTEFTPHETTGLGHMKHRDWQGVTGVRGEHAGCPSDHWIILAHDSHWVGKQDRLKALLDKLQGTCNCDFGTLDASGKCT